MPERPENGRVVVVGAGGLGGYVGAVLARAGRDVVLLARGAHADRIREHGLAVQETDGAWTVRPGLVGPDEPVEGVGAVLVAVKAYSLEEVAPTVSELSRDGAVVVSLLNGVDAAERLAEGGVAPDRIVDGVAYLTAFRTAPGSVERRGTHQRLVVGSATGRSAERVEDVVRLFEGTPVTVEAADDIRVELWRKMAVVCSLAALCGIGDAAIGRVRAHPFGADLQRRAIAEVLDVGRASGVPLGEEAEGAVGAVLDAFPEDFYPSVLHDLRSGRRTEMDALAGTLGRLGRRLGVPTPLLDAGACAVALAEERGVGTG